MPGGFSSYTGRFAPSPSGPLHAGSLVAALASFLDARAHNGRWLLRIEDIDQPRTRAGADAVIQQQLRALGMHWDGAIVWQSQRLALYQEMFARLAAQNLVYRCYCSRARLPAGPYPGNCRQAPPQSGSRYCWRLRCQPGVIAFEDRWLGAQTQDVAAEVGDFILRRTDGLWAYQMAVVVDDIAQQITHIVRGADLLDSTARQIMLARYLDAPYPRPMHVPLLLDSHGHKLSKQNHAPALDTQAPLACLQKAWLDLGFNPLAASSLEQFWQQARYAWAARFGE